MVIVPGSGRCIFSYVAGDRCLVLEKSSILVDVTWFNMDAVSCYARALKDI